MVTKYRLKWSKFCLCTCSLWKILTWNNFWVNYFCLHSRCQKILGGEKANYNTWPNLGKASFLAKRSFWDVKLKYLNHYFMCQKVSWFHEINSSKNSSKNQFLQKFGQLIFHQRIFDYPNTSIIQTLRLGSMHKCMH